MSSAKYYQGIKEIIQELAKDFETFLRNKKKKSNNMIKNDTKIYQNVIIIGRNYYFQKRNDLQKSFDGQNIKDKYQDALKNQF